MNTEQKVTSLELSKQLKEAGAKQESEYRWETESKWTDTGVALIRKPMGWNYVRRSQYAAFDCAELLERLPRELEHEDALYHLAVHVWGSTDEPYTAEYENSTGGTLKYTIANTPAEALGKLYLWCLKEGHCSD